MSQIIQEVINALISFAQSIWTAIFGDTNFSVLWSWLPSDIQAAASYLIMVLFVLAIIRVIRQFLPF